MTNPYIEHLRARQRACAEEDVGKTRVSWTLALRAGTGDLLIALVVMAVWISPGILWHGFIAHFEMVMFFEFFMIIFFGLAIAIAGSRAGVGKKVLGYILALLPFSGLIVAIIAEVGHPWPLIAVVVLFADKLLGFGGLSPYRARQLQGKLVFILVGMVALYMISMLVGVVIDWPALGVTRASVGDERFVTGGEWQSQPQRVLATGVVYFAGLAAVHTLLARHR